ncbi:MAG: L-threonylcarbamoyladenylate synthase [Acidiferrobacter sp.]
MSASGPGILRRDPAAVARIVRAGGVVGYAVEACFGLGCDPHNMGAVRRLLRLKRRPAAKGLIVLAYDPKALRPYARDLPPQARATWPGPHTWLVEANPMLSTAVRGHHSEVAVRVTAHRQAAQLARLCGGALISTSANRARERPARSHRELCRRMGRGLDAVLAGRIGHLARPTPIRDARSGRLVRR